MIKETSDYYVFLGNFEDEVIHSKLGIIRRNSISYEYYWKNEWFNIFRFQEPDGEFRNYYCNVNRPPTFNDGVLDFVDLDIDLVIWKDLKVEILDMDEFEENKLKYGYTLEIQHKALESLNKLIRRFENREFPFECNEF